MVTLAEDCAEAAAVCFFLLFFAAAPVFAAEVWEACVCASTGKANTAMSAILNLFIPFLLFRWNPAALIAERRRHDLFFISVDDSSSRRRVARNAASDRCSGSAD